METQLLPRVWWAGARAAKLVDGLNRFRRIPIGTKSLFHCPQQDPMPFRTQYMTTLGSGWNCYCGWGFAWANRAEDSRLGQRSSAVPSAWAPRRRAEQRLSLLSRSSEGWCTLSRYGHLGSWSYLILGGTKLRRGSHQSDVPDPYERNPTEVLKHVAVLSSLCGAAGPVRAEACHLRPSQGARDPAKAD